MNALALNSRLPLPLLLTTSFGLFCGLLLILTEALFTTGPLVLIPYALLVLGAAVILKTTGVPGYWNRFWLGLGSFMLGTLVLYIYLTAFTNPAVFQAPLWAQVWPLLLMAGIGGIIMLVVAYLTD